MRFENYEKIEWKEYLEYNYMISKMLCCKTDSEELKNYEYEKEKVLYSYTQSGNFILKKYKKIIDLLKKNKELFEKEVYEAALYKEINNKENYLANLGVHMERRGFEGTAEEYLEFLKLIYGHIKDNREHSKEQRNTVLY